MARPKRDLTRITTNLPTDLLDQIDDFAAKHSLPRSTAIIFLLTIALKGQEVE